MNALQKRLQGFGMPKHIAEELGKAVLAETNPLTGGIEILGLTSGVSQLPRPTDVIAQAMNRSARLIWKSGSVGVPKEWRIKINGSEDRTIPADSVNGSAVITGLTNGVAYNFTVAAVGLTADSPESYASNTITPTDVSAVLPVTHGLEFWWSAAQVANQPANGATYASMPDMSGNGHNAAGVGNPTWVSNWSNGKPAVACNGTSQYFNTLASGLWGGMRGPKGTVYVCYKVVGNKNAAGATGGRVLSLERPSLIPTDRGGGGFALGVGSTDTLGGAEVYNQSNQASASTSKYDQLALPSSPMIAAIQFPSPKWRIKVGAGAAVDVTGNVDPLINLGAGQMPWCFGAMYAGGFNKYANIQIAEIIIFNEVHTSAEITAMETYLAGRY